MIATALPGLGAKPTATGGHFVEERIFFPAGFDPTIDQHRWAIGEYQVEVRMDGRFTGWTVTSGGRHVRSMLAVDGRWILAPLDSEIRARCTHPDFDTACRLAEAAVETLTRNHQTWADRMAGWEKEKDR